MTTITVRGTARVAVAPDRATVDLGIGRVAPTASEALDTVARLSHELADLLAALGIERADWATQGIAVAEEWQWRNDTNVKVGHRATSGATVRVIDLDVVPTLLSRAVDEIGADVRGVRWAVSEHHPARHALLGAAAIDATHRADAYAEALGLVRSAVEEISDLPLPGAAGTAGGGDAMFASRAKAADSVEVHTNPGEIELTASVHVRFATLPH